MTTPTRLAFGRFVLLPAQRTLLRDGVPVQLGSRAFDLLAVLAENAGTIVTKEVLMARVWQRVVVDEGSLRVHIALLRKALREEETGERHIANVPRRGYSLVSAVDGGPLGVEAATGSGLPLEAPQPPAPLIGREEATEAAARTLLHRRFLTLVGPGGIGKTSLAVASAARLHARAGMQVCFVDLGALDAGGRIEPSVAAALRLSGTSSTDIHEALRHRPGPPLVLLLDNCEHVVEAAATFAEEAVLRVGGACVLATSREPLRARGEWVQRLQPLAVPPLGTVLRFQEALRYAAFELFVQRATAGSPDLQMGEADVAAIARLCHRLEGNPLALELAAGQAGFFGLTGLLAHLDATGDVPPAGWRTAAPRHHSMTASLRWSFQLLTPAERRMFSRLSRLGSPFTLAAATALAPNGEASAETAQALISLVRKSLVLATMNERDTQYRMCEATRAFAAAQAA